MNKQADIIVLDVGASMARLRNRGLSGLDKSKKAIRLLIQQKLLFFKKSDVMGIVLVGTSGTDNLLNDSYDANYLNVSVARDLEPVDLPFLEMIDSIQNENVEGGDIFDGILVATAMLDRFVGTKKYTKRLYVLTDAGEIIHDADQLDKIAAHMINDNMKVNIIGVDFSAEEDDDEEEENENDMSDEVKPIIFDFDESKYEDALVKDDADPHHRSYRQVVNERLLRNFTARIHGVVFPCQDALAMMSFFKTRTVAQTSKFRGDLQLGDLRIPVHTFGKTMLMNMPSLKKHSEVAGSMPGGEDSSCEVKMDRTYINKMNPDADTEGVAVDERVKAYRYGKERIPFSEFDESNLKLETERSLQVLGFVKKSKIPRHNAMSGTDLVVAAPGVEAAGLGLSALVHACHQSGYCILVRYVKRKNASPLIGFLEPKIKESMECFYWNQYPFSSDIRTFPFASLDTNQFRVDRKEVDVAKNLVKKLNLMTAVKGDDDDDEPTQALHPKRTFNPCLQRFYQTVETRALDPQAAVGPLDPVIAEYVNPNEKLFSEASGELKAFHDAFPLKVMTQRKKKEYKNWADAEAAAEEVKNNGGFVFGQMDMSDDEADDVDDADEKTLDDNISLDQFNTAKVTSISTISPVADFEAMWKQREDPETIDKAIKMMWDVVSELIDQSFKNKLFPKAIECIKALRTGCIQEDEWQKFNEGLKTLRSKYEQKKPAFWVELCTAAIMPISSDECTESDVTPASASSFIASPSLSAVSTVAEKVDDADDLFDELD